MNRAARHRFAGSAGANPPHWAAANVRDPGAPVPGNLGPEPLGPWPFLIGLEVVGVPVAP